MPAVDAELVEDVLQVVVHRPDRQHELLGDRPVGLPGSRETRDLVLPLRQLGWLVEEVERRRPRGPDQASSAGSGPLRQPWADKSAA
jgi:hypothetical protein